MQQLEKIGTKRIIYATTFGILAACCHSVATLLAKLIANNTTESVMVFFRLMVSLFWVLSVFATKRLTKKQFSIKTNQFGLHLFRAISGFITIFSLYYALKYVPLVDANSLALTYTLFIPVLSYVFLGTKTNYKNWLALIAGFIGIIFILKPYGSDFNPMGLMALISGIATAVTLLSIHELAKKDKPYTIMFYNFHLTFILSGIFAIFNWKTPNLTTLAILFLIGIIGTAYQELLTRALLYAPPKIVSPLLYFSVIFSGFFDWVFWHHMPDIYYWIGMTLVASGCIFSIKYAED